MVFSECRIQLFFLFMGEWSIDQSRPPHLSVKEIAFSTGLYAGWEIDLSGRSRPDSGSRPRFRMEVNGKSLQLDANPGIRNLLDLIGHYGLDPVTIAVEINGEIPKRDQWSSIALKESDRIEFIRFVGGG